MTTPTRSLFIVSCAAFALQLSACDREDSAESSRREPVAVESRDLGQYSAIDMRGAAQINIVVGPTESLKIEGDSRSVARMRTEVRDNTLYIRGRKDGWSLFDSDDDELRITIELPKLLSLRSSGAGNIQLSGLNGGEQVIKVSGAHNVEASGTLDKVTIEMEGAGNVDYGRVTSQDATVTVKGAGHVLVRATQTLSATMNGVGAIHFEGDPQKVVSNLHGIGSISKK